MPSISVSARRAGPTDVEIASDGATNRLKVPVNGGVPDSHISEFSPRSLGALAVSILIDLYGAAFVP